MGIQMEDPFPVRLRMITIQPSARHWLLGGLVHLLEFLGDAGYRAILEPFQ
jgi:hypothetical protein